MNCCNPVIYVFPKFLGVISSNLLVFHLISWPSPGLCVNYLGMLLTFPLNSL